jgi:hypothetical protein
VTQPDIDIDDEEGDIRDGLGNQPTNDPDD